MDAFVRRLNAAKKIRNGKSLGRTIRKSKNTSLELIKYIKTNHPNAYKKVKFTDKLKMYFRIVFR